MIIDFPYAAPGTVIFPEHRHPTTGNRPTPIKLTNAFHETVRRRLKSPELMLQKWTPPK